MAKTKYSATRCSTFESCRLKYHLTYKQGLYAEQTSQNVVTRKGLAFHEFAEHFQPEWTEEQIQKSIDDYMKVFTVPAEYDINIPARKFVDLYNNFVRAEMEKGAEYYPEKSFDFDIEGSRFTGKLDIFIKCADGTFWIIDHKTAKTANTTHYKNQLLLYSWAVAQEYGIPEEEMVKRIKVAVFFPFAEGDYSACFKKLRVNQKGLEEVKKHYSDITKAAEGDWEPEAQLNRLCDYCHFGGFEQYCPTSVQIGMVRTRGVSIKQRDWAKKII